MNSSTNNSIVLQPFPLQSLSQDMVCYCTEEANDSKGRLLGHQVTINGTMQFVHPIHTQCFLQQITHGTLNCAYCKAPINVQASDLPPEVRQTAERIETALLQRRREEEQTARDIAAALQEERRPRQETRYPISTRVYNGVLHLHILQGEFQSARQLTHTMVREGIRFDLDTYRTLFRLDVQQEGLTSTLNRWEACLRATNTNACNAVLEYFVQQRHHQYALDYWLRMQQAGFRPNLLTYNTLLQLYGQLHNVQEVFTLWNRMQLEGIQPNLRTYRTVLQMQPVLQTSNAINEFLSLIQEIRQAAGNRSNQ